MKPKTFRVKAKQFRKEKVETLDGYTDLFLLPFMRMDNKEFLVKLHPLRKKNWYLGVGDCIWNYHKSWLVFLDEQSDTVSK